MRLRNLASAVTGVVAALVLCSHRTQAAMGWNTLFGERRYEPPKRCNCACGVPNRSTRVVGGRPSRINEYPWTVALTYRGRFYCGGTLINDRYVLTAAHCINGLNHHRVEVTLGEHDRNLPFEAITLKTRVLWWLKHPDFDAKTFNNDIAVIRMKDPVDFSRIMRPVCLPKPGYNYTGEKVTVVGWGRTSEGGNTANLLQEVLLPVFSNAECRSLKYDPEEITNNMLCAGYTQGKIDACQGDSGGPMLWQSKDGKTDLIGIVSWGQGCGRPGLPGVYTRVVNYLDWIEENTPDACYCGRRTPRGRRHAPGGAQSSANGAGGSAHSSDSATAASGSQHTRSTSPTGRRRGAYVDPDRRVRVGHDTHSVTADHTTAVTAGSEPTRPVSTASQLRHWS
ncbi:trypsin-1-like isoform X2 [Amphibalanus amphitrite]|uniref:trypsin-1-like isoform X2 n=1 Tax=Amphibalanus amphitrite TaxID=1232801 RepID=UPI001C90E7C6|nr:trypsin-1-like isoform X2 [Amphibalanus amphitrite]